MTKLQAKTERTTKARGKAKGLWGTRIYRIWYGIYSRCYNKNNRQYSYYGKRGVVMCDEWLNDIFVFRDWAVLNGYSDELTIDRIDNNGNYEPSNCRWVDMRKQSNNRRSNAYLSYNGETHTIAEWSRIVGIKERTLWRRKNIMKWSDGKTITTPCKSYRNKSSYTQEQILLMKKDKDNGLTYNEIGIKYGINRKVASTLIHELKEQIKKYEM